jgi:hypothetical protein
MSFDVQSLGVHRYTILQTQTITYDQEKYPMYNAEAKPTPM